MILYSAELWAAALEASYALEGVKDQREMNRMVAFALLENAARWDAARPGLVGKLAANHMQVLDKHHAASHATLNPAAMFVWAARHQHYGTFGYYEDHSAVVVAETESAALGAVLGVYDKTVAKDWSFERVCRAEAEASGGVWQLGEYERG